MSDNKDFQIEKGVLTAYHGQGGDVVIPEGVTRIKADVFSGDPSLTGIRIPKSMTVIGYGAFYGCRNLRNIHIPDSIKEIFGFAFAGCVSLQTVTIPSSVVSISENAFADCRHLTEIHISENVNIGYGVFRDCRNLSDASGMLIIHGVLYDYFGQSEDIVIPENVRVIREGAFRYYRSIRSITVGSHVKEMKKAFAEDVRIEKFVLAPVAEDEAQAKMFLDVIGTRVLAIPFLRDALETNKIIRTYLLKRMILKANRFPLFRSFIQKGDSDLTAKLLSMIPKMPVDEIDAYIALSENDAEIRAIFIEYKNRLYPPEILDKMEEIQMEKALGFRKKTIADHQKLFKIKKVNYRYLLRHYKGDSPHVIIPSMIGNLPVELCDEAFASYFRIETVYIEDGIKTIPWRAFNNCQNLKNVNIPESVKDIGSQAFYGCTNLESITGAEGIIEIGYEAFGGCKQLKNITLPVGLKTIGNFVFRGCVNLQYLTLPESITEIGSYAFNGCPNLTICAPVGSYAEIYAKTNNINFQPQ